MRFFQKAVAGPVKPSKNTPGAICPLDPLAEDERGHPNAGHAALHQNQSWKRPLLKVNPSFYLSSLKVFLCSFACRITAVGNAPLKHFQAQVLKGVLGARRNEATSCSGRFYDNKPCAYKTSTGRHETGLLGPDPEPVANRRLPQFVFLESNFRRRNIIFKWATVWRVHIIFPFAVSNAADWLLEDGHTPSGKALFNALPCLRTSLCIDGFFHLPRHRISTVGTGKNVQSLQSLPFKHSILQSFHFFALPILLDPCA